MAHDSNTSLADDVFLLLTVGSPDVTVLREEGCLAELLVELARAIDMNPIRPPSVCRAVNNPGLEAYLPIDASNITISTYTEKPRLVVCIHSCKSFDVRRVTQLLQENTRSSEIRHYLCRESEFTEAGL